MARANRVSEDLLVPAAEPVTETVTYLPGPMDPSSTKWCGHTFHANVPKEITGHAEGSERDKLNLHLIERARENKMFAVGNERPKRAAPSLPTTAEQYRRYAVEWLKDPAIEHVEHLIARLAKDRPLQEACEVGSDDYSFLATLFMPKLHELQQGDELTTQQVSAIWINHGYNVLPW